MNILLPKLYSPLILALLVLMVYRGLISQGLPETHDGQAHVARIAQYYLAFNQGQFPPRWAPNLNYGFGYPVFNFNYPLPYILGLILMKAQFSLETTYLWLLLGSLIASSWGMYWLLLTRISIQAAFLGGFFYASSNYALLLIFVRGGIGEVLAYALLPWLIYLYDDLICKRVNWTKPKFWAASIVTSGFLLAHNIMAILGLGLLLGFIGWRLRRDGKYLPIVILPIILGVLMSLFFWFPALGEQAQTVINDVPLNLEFQKHFPTMKQLVFDAWGYGYSRVGPVDGLSFNLNPWWILILVIGFLPFYMFGNKRWALVLYICLIIWLFFLLPISLPIWQSLPMATFIQFPWRLLFFWPILAVPLIALIFERTKKAWIIWSVVIVGFVCGLSGRAKTLETFSHPPDYWFHYTESTSILDENMPKGFDKNVNYPLVKTMFVNSPVATNDPGALIKIEEWTGSQRKYQVNTDKDTLIIERVAYFPGTKLWANNQPVEIIYNNPLYPGLVTYQLPSGEYKIFSKFTQDTLSRFLGNTISFLAFVMVLVGLTSTAVKTIRKRPR